jgi:hypothetical protein
MGSAFVRLRAYAPIARLLMAGQEHGAGTVYFSGWRTSGKVADLPFPFGHHWQDGRSGLILARGPAKRS